MKKFLLVTGHLSLVTLLIGCATQQIAGDRAAQVRNFIQNIEPGLRPAAAAACSLTLSVVVDPADRVAVKKNLAKVSAIVAAVTPDQTPGQLSKTIQASLPVTTENRQLADSIAGGYGIALPFIKGDTQLFLKVISDLAAGINDAVSASAQASARKVNPRLCLACLDGSWTRADEIHWNQLTEL